MDPLKIIQKYYNPTSQIYKILVRHSEAVRNKALKIAMRRPDLNPDLKFISEAAILHDIGIFRTKMPRIGCSGCSPSICHGVLGREILEKEGFPKHALVCERHVGVGLTAEDIKKYRLPLPMRNMTPISVEEQIICLADKFFSKTQEALSREKCVSEIKRQLLRLGPERVEKFNKLLKKFYQIVG